MELTQRKAAILFGVWLLMMIFGILNSGCSASHKLKTSTSTTVNSAITVTNDTMHVTKEKSSSSNLTAKDVHVRIEYEQPTGKAAETAADTALALAKQRPARPSKTGNKIVDAIQDAISASGSAGRLPSSITIDIGSISDSTVKSSRKDSGAGKSTSTAVVHKEEQTKSKEVTRPGMSLFAKLGIWLLIVLVIGAIYYRYRGKIKAVKDFFLK